MSHLHIPDGVLPLWIVAAGWLTTAVLLFFSARSLREPDQGRRLPLLGVVSALMLVAMTVELVPIGYHLNLTVIAGILLGPALGFVAAFIVNLILAFFGHGGITVVGLNTLVTGTEIVLGYYIFRGLRHWLGTRPGLAWETAAAVVIVLFAGTLLMIGIVAASNVNPAVATPTAGAVEPGTLSFRNPFGEGVVEWRPFAGEPESAQQPQLNLTTFAALVLGLGAIGWVLEALVTALVVVYLSRLRPDLIGVPPPPPKG